MHPCGKGQTGLSFTGWMHCLSSSSRTQNLDIASDEAEPPHGSSIKTGSVTPVLSGPPHHPLLKVLSSLLSCLFTEPELSGAGHAQPFSPLSYPYPAPNPRETQRWGWREGGNVSRLVLQLIPPRFNPKICL